ncbi:TIGR03621 family F420-dependent LLM class oxidoreductase [Nocardiopsis alba]|jgi:probable F420-dependent oxidoreductase
MSSGCTRKEWVERCRTAEALGYDVIGVADHLNLMSPFPMAVAAAEATTLPRIGLYVINSCFYNHALLARDISTTDLLTEGRLEMGLGTGYVRREFDEAGVEFGSGADRVDRLEAAVVGLRHAFSKEEGAVLPSRSPHPPLLIGGHGRRVLGLAAREADTVSFTGARFRPEFGRTGLVTASVLRERVDLVLEESAGRAVRPELNVLSKATVLTGDRRAAAAELGARYAPDLEVDRLLELPTLFTGTPEQIAEQIRGHSEEFGLTYFTVMDAAMEDFGQVIERLR